MRSALFRMAVLIGCTGVLGYAFFALRGPQGLPALFEKNSEIRELERQNAQIQRENELKSERIQRLQKSTPEQELEIRKRLKLVKPNEKIYIIGN